MKNTYKVENNKLVIPETSRKVKDGVKIYFSNSSALAYHDRPKNGVLDFPFYNKISRVEIKEPTSKKVCHWVLLIKKLR